MLAYIKKKQYLCSEIKNLNPAATDISGKNIMKTILYKNEFYHYAYAVVLVYQNEENKKVKSHECVFLDEEKAKEYAEKKERAYKQVYKIAYTYIDLIRIEL